VVKQRKAAKKTVISKFLVKKMRKKGKSGIGYGALSLVVAKIY